MKSKDFVKLKIAASLGLDGQQNTPSVMLSME